MKFLNASTSFPTINRCRSMRIEQSVFEGNAYTLQNSESLHLIDYHARIRHGDTERILEPGDWVYTPPKVTFEYLELETGSHQYFHYATTPRAKISSTEIPHGKLGTHFQRLWNDGEVITQDFNASDKSLQAMANHGLYILLHRIQNEAANNLHRSQAPKKRSDYIIDTIASELNKNLHEVVDVNALCDHYEISPAYLNKRFRNTFGCSVSNYHMNRRLHYACELISDTTLPFTSIARETGFYDYHHFNKKMRQHLGMNPSQYREQTFEQQSQNHSFTSK